MDDMDDMGRRFATRFNMAHTGKDGKKCSGCGKDIEKGSLVLADFSQPNTLVWHLKCAVPMLKDEMVGLGLLVAKLESEEASKA